MDGIRELIAYILIYFPLSLILFFIFLNSSFEKNILKTIKYLPSYCFIISHIVFIVLTINTYGDKGLSYMGISLRLNAISFILFSIALYIDKKNVKRG